MWISLNWIKRLADLPEINVRTLADRVTISIAEVEGYEQTNAHLNNVYSAKILEIAKIPETDHLQVTKVDTGSEILQVVCGAPNIKVGDVVPLAKVGTVLPLEDGKTLKIKKGKLKGVESFGMLCSAKELKLSSDHGGIMMLDKEIPLDTPLANFMDSDTLIEIDNKSITHRPDLWGHLGFAREISALLGGNLKKNYYNDTFKNDYENRKSEVDLKVTIEDSEKCRRYNGLVLKNIKVTDSPLWIQKALLAVGLTPINNIVDATNFVMLELGQPMHAFDLEKLSSPEIFVKYANKDEKIKALDDNEYQLLDTHLVIADKDKSIAVAGVIGGDNTKIEESTTSVVLESANFHASTIRIAANKIGVRTDSSNRFEKSLDPENTIDGIKLAYHIIKESSPEVYIASELVDEYPTKLDQIVINISCDRIRKKLGLTIENLDNGRIKEILSSLYFKVSDKDGMLSLIVPSFRATKDVGIDADIVEEIGRIYGYDNIEPIPFLSEVKPPNMNKERLFERELKNLFVNRYDFNEVYNYSFVSEDDIKAFGENPDDYLGLKNYLSTDYTKIRRDLYISALKTVKVNLKHSDYFAFFEVGRGYHLEEKEIDGLAKEHRYLMATHYVQNAEESKDKFYEMKNIIIEYFSQIGFKGVMPRVPQKVENKWAHPYRVIQYKRGRDLFAEVVEFDPRFLVKNGVNGRVVTLKIDLVKLFKAKKSITKFNDLPKYPYSNFEVTVLADKKVYVSDIIEIAKRSCKKLFKDVELLAIYEGSSIPEDKKSISIKVTIGDDNRTLKTKEIEKTLDNVIAQLKKKGFELKS